MANWSLPSLGSLYTDVIALFKSRDDALATQFDSGSDTSTSLIVGTKRWNDTTKRWNKWDGAAWVELATTYGISVSGNSATTTLAANSTLFGGLPLTNFVRTISGTSPDGSGNVVVDMSSKLNLTGGELTGNLTLNGGDLKAYRAGGTTGYVRLNAAGDRHLYYNGTSYELPGASLLINGATAYTTANLNIGNSRTYPRRSDGADANFIWLGGQGNLSYYWGSNDGINHYPVLNTNMSVGNANTVGSYGAGTFLQSFYSVAYDVYYNSSIARSQYGFRFYRLNGSFVTLFVFDGTGVF